MENIFITGGAGYVGSVLVPKLLNAGYKVSVFDILYFGSHLAPHENLKVIQGDIRDVDLLDKSLKNHDAVIHLACISNDPSFELDPKLSKQINFDAFEPLVRAAKNNGIKKFIYASTSSVYGISDQKEVTEDHPLLPITDYNKFKGMCEPILNNYKDDNFQVMTIRPATVCGYSPRLRLDLTVNILTNHAFHNGKILIFGGKQLRPHIHIDDITDLYLKLIKEDWPELSGEIFNAGYDNQSVEEVSEAVAKIVAEIKKEDIQLEYTPSDDIRSYHICSKKIKSMLNFRPKKSIEDAVKELSLKFQKGEVQNSFTNSNYFNIKKMQENFDA